MMAGGTGRELYGLCMGHVINLCVSVMMACVTRGDWGGKVRVRRPQSRVRVGARVGQRGATNATPTESRPPCPEVCEKSLATRV